MLPKSRPTPPDRLDRLDQAGPPAQAASLASRWRQRLFPPWSSRDGAAPAPQPVCLPVPVAKRQLGFQASLAEFLLVNRLRARLRAASCADVLERASRIVFVTCKNWFGGAPDDPASPSNPSNPTAPQRAHPRHQTRL